MTEPVPPDAASRSGGAGGRELRYQSMSAEAAAFIETERERLRRDTELVRREREMGHDPSPLAEPERAVIQAAIAPVIRDLRVTGAVVPDVRYEAHSVLGRDGRDGVHACLAHAGLWVPAEDASAAEQVWWIAHDVQEWEIHELWAAGRPATWPECPEHPGTHPLDPDVAGGTAVWRCPRSAGTTYPIGSLPATG